MSWSKELVILSSYSLIYVNLKKLQNCRNFQVNCSSSHHLWTKKDVLSKGYSVPDAQLFVPWPFLIFFKHFILADTSSSVPWCRRCRVLQTVSVGLWESSQADCPTYNPRKRDPYTSKGPSRFISGTSFFSSCWLQGPRARLQGLPWWVCPACDRFSKSGKKWKRVCKSSAEVGIPVSGGDSFCL